MNAFDTPAINTDDRDNDTATDNAPERTTAHDLGEFAEKGGVSLDDYANGKIINLADGREINELAWRAAGTTTGDRDISDGERGTYADAIDRGVRSYASFVESRPLDERLELRARPVIHVNRDGE